MKGAGKATGPLRALLGTPGLLVSFAWGFAEGTFFFIVPDLVITLAALFCPRRSLGHLGLVVAGSLVAGTVMYVAALRDPAGLESMVLKVPFVSPAMFETTAEAFERHGVWAMCLGPMSGIPYKVYAVQAPAFTGFVPFGLVSVPARLERLLLTWVIFAAAGVFARKHVRRRPAWAVGVYAVYWLAVYAYYWTHV
jgi:hypothetical protein